MPPAILTHDHPVTIVNLGNHVPTSKKSITRFRKAIDLAIEKAVTHGNPGIAPIIESVYSEFDESYEHQ